MKKVFLLTITVGLAMSSFAQHATRHFSGARKDVATPDFFTETLLNRTTGFGSVDTLRHIYTGDTLTAYYVGSSPFDSGFVSGLNAFGDKGFAERFDFTANDSTLQVTGMIYYFTGVVNPASTKTVDFKVWSVGAQTVVDPTHPKIFYSGLPNTVLASYTTSIRNIGVGGAVADTPKLILFPTPTAYLSSSFFIGCEFNYTWAGAAGDTVALVTNQDGERQITPVIFSGTDTVINDVVVTKAADNSWVDNWLENFQVSNDYVLFAIVKVGKGLSVNGITKKDFTFFGNYPNPAVSSTNIKYAVANTTDVTIQVMDMNGRVINTINQANVAAGEHIYNLPTANLAAGQYVYVIRTANGGGIAAQFSVIK